MKIKKSMSESFEQVQGLKCIDFRGCGDIECAFEVYDIFGNLGDATNYIKFLREVYEADEEDSDIYEVFNENDDEFYIICDKEWC